jgi:hypothetical protein
MFVSEGYCFLNRIFKAGKYKNTGDAVVKIFREEGLLTFYKGLESTLWRHASWNGIAIKLLHQSFIDFFQVDILV